MADNVFGNTLFMGETKLLKVWMNYPSHQLQLQEPNGDRQWIPNFEFLQKLTEFEASIGNNSPTILFHSKLIRNY